MSDDDHPLIQQVRQARDYPADAPAADVIKGETLKFALYSPEQRARHLYDTDRELDLQSLSGTDPSPKQRLQLQRYKQSLRNAHERLKLVGR